MKVAPKFIVTELPGTVARQVIEYVPYSVKVGETVHNDGKVTENFKTMRKRQVREVTQPAGFFVQTTRGHSMRIKNREELTRLGFNGEAPLIDLDTGEEIPQQTRQFGQIPMQAQLSGYNPEGTMTSLVEDALGLED